MAILAVPAFASAPAPSTSEPPAPNAHLLFVSGVVCHLQRPAVVTDAELVAALPVPDALAADDAPHHQHGRMAFDRLFHRSECVVYNYLGGLNQAVRPQLIACMDFVLRCSPPTPAIASFLSSTGEARTQHVLAIRRLLRSTPGWLDALNTARVYTTHGSVEDGPCADIVAAWERVTFDHREQARDALVRRRALQLVRARGRQLFEHPPAPGHPNAEDAEAHYHYLVNFGSHAESTTLFAPNPARDRTTLLLALRGAFPGWEPRRACGRLIEAWSPAAMAARLPASHTDGFERAVLDYIQLTLDSVGDREAALQELVRAHGARITPRLAYEIVDAIGYEDEESIRRALTRFTEAIWLPLVQPGRDLIVASAVEMQRAHDCATARSFLGVAMPDLVDWPCAADTAFVDSLLRTLVDPAERATLLSLVLAERIPEGAQHMSCQDIDAFLAPLLERVPDGTHRFAPIAEFIDMWTKHVPDAVGDRLLECTADAASCASIESAVERQRQRVEFAEWRAIVAAKRCERSVQDTPAPEGAPDDAVCIACTVNLRRVCFTPCGHIVTCIACAAKCKQTCPVCRAAVTHAQPCFVPQP